MISYYQRLYITLISPQIMIEAHFPISRLAEISAVREAIRKAEDAEDGSKRINSVWSHRRGAIKAGRQGEQPCDCHHLLMESYLNVLGIPEFHGSCAAPSYIL